MEKLNEPSVEPPPSATPQAEAAFGPVRRFVAPGICQIAFSDMDPSEPPRVEVRAWLERLGPLTAPMTAGLVVIQAVDEDHQERRYRVRMELTMPRGVVSIGHDHPSNGAHEDLYVAIRNAFRAARRQLEAYAQLHRAADTE